MELKKVLLEAIIDRYKASVVVRALSKQIREYVKSEVYNKCTDKIINRNGMTFEYYAASVCYDNFLAGNYLTLHDDKLEIREKVGFTVSYLITEESAKKLIKKKRDEVAHIRSKKSEWDQLPYNTYKIPLWYNFDFLHVKLDSILDGSCFKLFNVENGRTKGCD